MSEELAPLPGVQPLCPLDEKPNADGPSFLPSVGMVWPVTGRDYAHQMVLSVDEEDTPLEAGWKFTVFLTRPTLFRSYKKDSKWKMERVVGNKPEALAELRAKGGCKEGNTHLIGVILPDGKAVIATMAVHSSQAQYWRKPAQFAKSKDNSCVVVEIGEHSGNQKDCPNGKIYASELFKQWKPTPLTADDLELLKSAWEGQEEKIKAFME